MDADQEAFDEWRRANRTGWTADRFVAVAGFVVVLVALLFVDSPGGFFGGGLFGSIGWSVYCIPSAVAFAKSHRSRGWVVLINLALGWTLIGWGLALLWSLNPSISVPWGNTRGLVFSTLGGMLTFAVALFGRHLVDRCLPRIEEIRHDDEGTWRVTYYGRLTRTPMRLHTFGDDWSFSGPLSSSGAWHGKWLQSSRGGASYGRWVWYWYGEEVTEGEWHRRAGDG